MKRLSSYSILSNRMKSGGFVLLNGLSGAIDVLSDDLAEILSEKMKSTDHREIYFEEGTLSAEVINTLIKRGHITTVSHLYEQQQLETIANILHEYEAANPGIVIVPNIDCNYRCVYCFERPLQNKLDLHRKTAMDKLTVAKVYNAIFEIRNRFGNVGKEIVLYGGEPLNAVNKDIISEIIQIGVKEGFNFTAITNGHDLDVYLPLMGKDKISAIQVSIDGPKHVHDKMRISRDGTSSYEKIISNIRQVIRYTDTVVSIRVHIDNNNIKNFIDVIDSFNKEGWLNNERILIYASIIYIKDKDGRISPVNDINNIADILKPITEKYSNVMIGCSQTNYDFLVFSSLAENKPYRLRSGYCAASSGMYVFLPDGNLHSCWESIGKECSRIGNYDTDEGLELEHESCENWFGRSAARIPECADCQYCLVCGGGCPQYAQYNSGSLYKPFCDNFQKTYSWVLANSVERFLKGRGL